MSDEGGSGFAAARIEVFARGADPDAANPVLSEDASLTGDEWSLSATLSDGDYDLYAGATDGAGNTAVRQGPRAFRVQIPTDDTTPPVLTVSSPTEGQTLDMPALIAGTVSDEEGGSGVASVQLRVEDGGGVAVVDTVVAPQGESWSLGIDDLLDGDYTLYVDATDGAGNAAQTVLRGFSVLDVVHPIVIVDGYEDSAGSDPTNPCHTNNTRDQVIIELTSTMPAWSSDFDTTGGDFHDLLATRWKSRYEWREPTTDAVTNNESQTYLDVLGHDAGYRDTWSPFEQIVADDGNGYLAIRAAKADVVLPNGPIIDGAINGGQPYLSGVLTSYDSLPLSPAPGQTITIELKARMPRGQGVFPALWLYPRDFARGPRGYLRNDEIDLFEHIGQTPKCDDDPDTDEVPECYTADETTNGWRLPSETCPSCPSWRQNSYYTQYHNYHTRLKGKLKSIASEAQANDANFGAVYTNPSPGTPWRNQTWVGCDIDFSEKLHTYTLQWSADALVYYVDHIEVVRVDEAAEDAWLGGANIVPISTDEMAMNLNFALGSAENYIGPPDAYTEGAMDAGVLKMIVDYLRVWY